MSTVMDGVIIGGAGGAIAGITVYLIQYAHDKVRDKIESKKIYVWLEKNTKDKRGERYRSTRAIASWNNLTIDRVQYLCGYDKRIYLSTGENEDLWSIYIHSRSERDDEGPHIDVLGC